MKTPAIFLLFVVPAFAQDALKADPDHYSLILENDHVRVPAAFPTSNTFLACFT